MAWYIPLLIFGARICDVSIGTVRTMFVISGHSVTAAILGFIEVSIWVLAAGGAISNLTNPWAIIGYAGGFACGVYLGMWIEERIALGFRMVRVICRDNGHQMCLALREHGYRVTQIEGSGRTGPVEIAFLVIQRRKLNEVRAKIAEISPDAFVTIERVEPPIGGGFTDNRFGRRFLERIVVRK